MIPLSCADYAFPLLTRTTRFALLELLGFSYVDVGLFERNSGLRPAQLVADPKSFTKQLKHDLKYTSLRVSDVFLQIGLEPAVSAPNDPSLLVRRRNRKTFMLALDLCAALGCTHLTGLPGVRHNNTAEADDFALAAEEAGWRQHVASGAGITYAVEAHLGSLCPDVARTRAFIDAVPGLTLTLDYGHFVAANVTSREIHALLPLASHIHVRGGAPGRLQTPISENRIDLGGMMRRLRKRNYRGFLAIEYVWTDWQQCNRTDNVSETILLRRLLKDIQNISGKRAGSRKETAHV
jgi:sugar phosphate isomerase/epimerase